MSDLWNRCREILRTRMSDRDWRECIRPLRAWLADGVLYLWMDRALDDYRAIPVPAREFDGLIRKVVGHAWGRPPADVHYLKMWPNRERIINERRLREERVQARSRDAQEQEAFAIYCREAARRFEKECPDRMFFGSRAEQERQLLSLIEQEAKQKLENDVLSARMVSPGPRGAPRRARSSSPRAGSHRRHRAGSTSPSCTCGRGEHGQIPCASCTSPPQAPSTQSNPVERIDREEARAIIQGNMPWLDDV